VIAEVTGEEAGYLCHRRRGGGADAGDRRMHADSIPRGTACPYDRSPQRGRVSAGTQRLDHALRAAGITFVEAGYPATPARAAPTPGRSSAITDRTAALFGRCLTPRHAVLAGLADIARRHDLR